MKLLYSPNSPYARKVRIVMAEKRIECELVTVTGPHLALARYNPLGKVPTLVLDDDSALYDSRVIVDFLDNVSPIARLIPEGHRDRVAVRRWEALADGVLDAAILAVVESRRKQTDEGAAWIKLQMEKVNRGLAVILADLAGRQWCHNERYTLADIAVGCCLGYLDLRKPGGLDWTASLSELMPYYARLLERPAFAESAPK